jgi:hypothetical protein
MRTHVLDSIFHKVFRRRDQMLLACKHYVLEMVLIDGLDFFSQHHLLAGFDQHFQPIPRIGLGRPANPEPVAVTFQKDVNPRIGEPRFIGIGNGPLRNKMSQTHLMHLLEIMENFESQISAELFERFLFENQLKFFLLLFRDIIHRRRRYFVKQ